MNPLLFRLSWVVLALLTACGKESSADPRAKHLVLLTVDTVRADRLGCYGGPNPASPTVDRLAEQGVLFEHAYTPRGLTLPSMATFFTSKYPEEHGVTDNKKRLRPDEVLLAELLRESGFRNRAYVATLILRPERCNIEQGFLPGTYALVADEVQMTRDAVRFLDNKFGKTERREFLWVHYLAPHAPYKPPKWLQHQFTDPAYEGPDGSRKSLDGIYVNQVELEEEQRRHIEGLYDESIRFTDDAIGQILEALDRTGVRDETLVVFASDHGEDLYSHNYYYYHGNSIYRSCTQVPLIFQQSGQVAVGHRVSEMVSTLDFLPTVLGWLGIEDTGTGRRGIDLGPWLRGEEADGRPLIFSQWDSTIFSARDQNWSYIWNPQDHTPSGPPEEGEYPIETEELYDLSNDPDEQFNVASSHSKIVERLKRAVQRWRSELQVRRGEDAELTEELLQDLRELGYLEDGP